MFHPFTWAPVTVQGLGVFREGGAPQTSTTFPLTVPPAAALLSKMLPFDQTSPVSDVVELPWKVSDGPDPLQLPGRSEEHTSELQSQFHLVCRLLLEKKK